MQDFILTQALSALRAEAAGRPALSLAECLQLEAAEEEWALATDQEDWLWERADLERSEEGGLWDLDAQGRPAYVSGYRAPRWVWLTLEREQVREEGWGA